MRTKLKLALVIAIAAPAPAWADLLDEDEPQKTVKPAAPATKPGLTDDDEDAVVPPPAAPPPAAPVSPSQAPSKRPPKAEAKQPPKSLPDHPPARPTGSGGGSVLAPKGGGSGKADKDRAKEPVHFKSNGARGLREKGMFELLEDVVITQGDMRMEAEHAQIHADEKSREVLRVVADGEVKMWMTDADSGEKIKAFGDKVVFDNKTRTVVLEGNARLWRGADLVRGKKITYEMDTGWIRADRVAGEVHPDTVKGKP